MAYVELDARLTDAQVVRLVALTRDVDRTPGGGSRIVPLVDVPVDVQAFLEQACGRWVAVRVVALLASQQLVGHTDPPVRARRIHIPIRLNAGCWVFSAGTWQQLEEGRCYEMDPTQVHGAVNWGAETRLHLMIDTEL